MRHEPLISTIGTVTRMYYIMAVSVTDWPRSILYNLLRGNQAGTLAPQPDRITGVLYNATWATTTRWQWNLCTGTRVRPARALFSDLGLELAHTH